MRRLVAAPDKLRGTATAAEAANAICSGAARAGATCVAAPMSDGGEGFLESVGGTLRSAVVRGPLGQSVDAAWSLAGGTATIEAARAVGRPLLATPRGDDPVEASTYGVGQLVAAAARAGAKRIVVGCGGTATTDGGLGLLAALDDEGVSIRAALVAACDVRIGFLGAASMFGPQKGATSAQVAVLESRLADAAGLYRDRFGVDVAAIPGTGAAGGLAGALVALGATVVSGAAYVADVVGLDGLLGDADLVVTAEGSLDVQTLEGKAVSVVVARRPELAALVVVGRAEPAAVAALAGGRPGPLDVVVLDGALQRAAGTSAAIAEAVAGYLAKR